VRYAPTKKQLDLDGNQMILVRVRAMVVVMHDTRQH